MVIAAAGHIDHDELVDAASRQFDKLQNGSAPEWSAPKFGGGYRSAERPLDQVHMVLGFSAPGYRDERIYALQVLASVMGGGMSSRLFQELREKRGLVLLDLQLLLVLSGCRNAERLRGDLPWQRQ